MALAGNRATIVVLTESKVGNGRAQEARVPDIGGHDGVPVIELLVKVGDTVAKDQGLVTLESDKATMDVPAPFAGVVRESSRSRISTSWPSARSADAR